MSPGHTETGEQSPMHESSTFSRCFWIPCMHSHEHLRTDWWEHISNKSDKNEGDRWWCKGVRTFKKIKEWSELVAGPKWKTFIRRLSKKRSKHNSIFKYDPASYSLNFDEGKAHVEDDDLFFRDFSARYAYIPVSAKSSMDLGKDGLSFT
ncbi:hypothetical protein Tco_0567150 [Tanacetum coccineum]